MSRPALAAPIATAVLVAATVTAGVGAQPRLSKPGQASVVVAACHPSDDVAGRFAAFNGQMRAIAGSKRLAMHFTLLERLGKSRVYKAVSLPDLKPWRKSKPGARAFIYTQRITALRDGGAYRMRVQFRWYGDRKTLLRSTTVRSRTCRQPAPRPDLTVTSIGSVPAPAGRRTYAITVSNDGQGEARDVPVMLKVDDTVVGNALLDLLPGQESGLVQITGPRCAFSVRAVVDPDRLIPEADDSDNALTVPCAQAVS